MQALLSMRFSPFSARAESVSFRFNPPPSVLPPTNQERLDAADLLVLIQPPQTATLVSPDAAHTAPAK